MKAFRWLQLSFSHGFQAICIITPMWSLPTCILCMELSKEIFSGRMHVQRLLSLSKDYSLLYVILLLPKKEFCDILHALSTPQSIEQSNRAQLLMKTIKCSGIQQNPTRESSNLNPLSSQYISLLDAWYCVLLQKVSEGWMSWDERMQSVSSAVV